MQQPTYDSSIIPTITWSEIPPSWSCGGATGSFDDYPNVRFAYSLSANSTRLKLAYAKHTTELKDALKDKVSSLLRYTTSCINYGSPGAAQNVPIVYDLEADQDITTVLQEVYDTLAETANKTVTVGNGVQFEGTLMAGYSEREFMSAMTYCQIRHGSEIPGVGRNVRAELVLSEHASRTARPDAVEYDDEGNVITIIECQSGIKNGTALDNDHFARIISEYPYHPDFGGKVRKLVVIAGEYMPWHVEALRAAPFEVVILQTAIQNDVVVLRPYAE